MEQRLQRGTSTSCSKVVMTMAWNEVHFKLHSAGSVIRNLLPPLIYHSLAVVRWSISLKAAATIHWKRLVNGWARMHSAGPVTNCGVSGKTIFIGCRLVSQSERMMARKKKPHVFVLSIKGTRTCSCHEGYLPMATLFRMTFQSINGVVSCLWFKKKRPSFCSIYGRK